MLAPWCLKAGVESFCKNNHNIKIIETTINGNIEAFAEQISGFNPEIIAIPCYIWNISYIIKLCQLLREQTTAKIALGGPEVAYRSTEILSRFSFIDFVISGEGEWTFSSFIDALSNELSLENAEGLSFRINNLIISNNVLSHRETPPSPYCDEYFAALNNRIAYIETSRGCPFRCSYCLSGRLEKMRCFDLAGIFDNIIKLSNSGSKTIKFIDRTFNADENHCCAILEFILKETGKRIPSGVCFHFEISADILTDRILELFARFPKGLCQLEIGIQSYNKKTLKSINRHCNAEKLDKNINNLLSKNNIHIHTDLIAGLPYEDLNSFIETFNIAYKNKPHMLQLGFLKLLSGAELNSASEKFSYIFNSAPPYEIISNSFLSNYDLSFIKLCECALDKLYNNGRFLITLDYISESTKLSPFDIFRIFSEFSSPEKISLSKLSENLYNCFSAYCSVDILRECILCDLASIDANISIADSLKKYDKEYKTLKKYYSEKYQSVVNIVICKSRNKVYVVDTSKEKDLRNRWAGEYFDL